MLQILADILCKIGRLSCLLAILFQNNRTLSNRIVFRRCNLTRRPQIVQHHIIAPIQRTLGMVNRRIGKRPLQKPDQQRTLIQRQTLDILPKKTARSSLNTVRTIAKIHLIKIHRNNLALGICALQKHGSHLLLNFALPRWIQRQKNIARQLLRQRTRTVSL